MKADTKKKPARAKRTAGSKRWVLDTVQLHSSGNGEYVLCRASADEYDELMEAEAFVAAGISLPPGMVQALLPLARQALDKRQLARRLPAALKHEQDLVIARWRNWRKQKIAEGVMGKKWCTDVAVRKAAAELKQLAATHGPRVLLSEATRRSRLTRREKR